MPNCAAMSFHVLFFVVFKKKITDLNKNSKFQEYSLKITSKLDQLLVRIHIFKVYKQTNLLMTFDLMYNYFHVCFLKLGSIKFLALKNWLNLLPVKTITLQMK